MDNGQTLQPNTNQPFFPEGDGVSGEGSPENNLDLTNPNTFGESQPTRGQNQNFGRNAINGQPVENPNDSVEFEAPTPGPDFGPMPEILQITETEPAPAASKEESNDYNYDSTVMKIEGDSLNPKAVDAMTDMEKSFKKTGDAASFVSDFEKTQDIVLEQSFNRKLGNS